MMKVVILLSHHWLSHFHCLLGEKNVTTSQNVEVDDAHGSLPRYFNGHVRILTILRPNKHRASAAAAAAAAASAGNSGLR